MNERYGNMADSALVDEGGGRAQTEMMRRLKDALEAQEKSSNELGRRIWWLNFWLLILTGAIFVLTIVQILIALKVIR